MSYKRMVDSWSRIGDSLIEKAGELEERERKVEMMEAGIKFFIAIACIWTAVSFVLGVGACMLASRLNKGGDYDG